ncbi:hypothetical protein LguiB_024765 [Lonicera macranthoides]
MKQLKLTQEIKIPVEVYQWPWAFFWVCGEALSLSLHENPPLSHSPSKVCKSLASFLMINNTQ